MENNEITEVSTGLTQINNDALYLLTKAEVDVQISTAKAFPRSLKMFLDKAMSMATLSEDIAASCSYSLPRGGKSLDGPSVRLAEIVCSSYGNIRAGARVIANDGKTITAQGVCHDLETNNSVTVEVKRSILQHEYKDGKKTGRLTTMKEDMQVVTGNAACAIAYRNAVFKVVPAALVQDVYDKAKEVARGTAETLVKRRDKAVEYFRSLKVTDAQICEALELKRIEDIDLDKLSTLTGIKAAIKNGEATMQSIFFSGEVEADKKKSERLTALLADCKSIEQVDALQAQMPDADVEIFNARKEQIAEELKSKVPAMSNDVLMEIETAETMKHINAIIEAYPALQTDKEFTAAVNKRKIEIGKSLKKQTA
jgi:hypothetical protein